VLRGGFAIQAEQPITNPLISIAANPPNATPLSFTSTAATPYVSFQNAVTVAGTSTLAPSTTPKSFKDAYTENYNLNLQYAVTPTMTAQIGYYGLAARHLRLTHNINRPIGNARPFTAVSASSAIAPGRALGNITNYDSDGMSNYNSLWLVLTKQMRHGLQFNTSYVYGKSLDLNSLSTQGVILPDSSNPDTNYVSFGLRCPSPLRVQRRVYIAYPGQLPADGVAAFRHRSVAERQSLHSNDEPDHEWYRWHIARKPYR
jgi:hypothetical protein